MAVLLINVEFSSATLRYFRQLDLHVFQTRSVAIFEGLTELQQFCQQDVTQTHVQLEQRQLQNWIIRIKYLKRLVRYDYVQLTLPYDREILVQRLRELKTSLIQASNDLSWRLNDWANLKEN